MLIFKVVWPSYVSKTNPHCLKGVFPTLGIWVTPQSNPFKTQVEFQWMNHSWIRLSVYPWIHPAKHWLLSTVDICRYPFLGAKTKRIHCSKKWSEFEIDSSIIARNPCFVGPKTSEAMAIVWSECTLLFLNFKMAGKNHMFSKKNTMCSFIFNWFMVHFPSQLILVSFLHPHRLPSSASSPPLCADPQRKLDPFKIELVGGFFPTRGGCFLCFLVEPSYLKNMRKSNWIFFPQFSGWKFEKSIWNHRPKKKTQQKKLTSKKSPHGSICATFLQKLTLQRLG